MGNGSSLISPELREGYNQMTFGYKLMLLYVNIGDRHFKWYKLPVFMGLMYLEFRPTVHQKYNLIAIGPNTGNTGEYGAFIGLNMEQAPAKSVTDRELLDPHPAVVATKVLNRKEFVGTGKQFNMLAASWINFMIHDWIDHEEDESNLEVHYLRFEQESFRSPSESTHLAIALADRNSFLQRTSKSQSFINSFKEDPVEKEGSHFDQEKKGTAEPLNIADRHHSDNESDTERSTPRERKLWEYVCLELLALLVMDIPQSEATNASQYVKDNETLRPLHTETRICLVPGMPNPRDS
ncbi:hypothetical protein R1sor_005109 [Riccia sorocarpa]|uniref:Uncharacterized protein n=1 Tax=Riccia sorocarpa TaxID=122646 RepID=A0ABD3HIK8_9MARC